MKKILVTGGAGFIGSNLISNLLLDNQNIVTCLDNLDSFYPVEQKLNNIQPFLQHPDFEFIEGDIRSKHDLNKINEVSVIIHLAAKAGVRPSISDPASYLDVNVNGTKNLLDFAASRGITQFVFASSSSVYGVSPNVPWTEQEELIPISPYASTKLMGEMLGETFANQYGIRFLALRFFTVYGAAQRPDLAIHKFFKAIAAGMPLTLYGDGSTGRDYTHVTDIIDGIIAAIDYDKSNFEILNIGNNHTISLHQLVEAIENCLGKKAIIERLPEQDGDVPLTYADISKAKALLNYYPKTKLADGLNAFREWFKVNQRIYQ